MDNSVLIAIITVSGSIVVAGLTFYFTKRHQLAVEWQHEKLNHYKVLLSALSDIALDGTNKDDAVKRFSLASNTIALVASQDVISALMNYHSELLNPTTSPEKQEKPLKELMLVIRKDIGLSGEDNKDSFNFHLLVNVMGRKPK